MEAPEKIWMNDDWVHQFDVKEFMGEDSIEYTRTDVFIEKAEKWLKDNASNYIIEHPFSSDVDFEEDKMIDDFKSYIKRE